MGSLPEQTVWRNLVRLSHLERVIQDSMRLSGARSAVPAVSADGRTLALRLARQLLSLQVALGAGGVAGRADGASARIVAGMFGTLARLAYPHDDPIDALVRLCHRLQPRLVAYPPAAGDVERRMLALLAHGLAVLDDLGEGEEMVAEGGTEAPAAGAAPAPAVLLDLAGHLYHFAEAAGVFEALAPPRPQAGASR